MTTLLTVDQQCHEWAAEAFRASESCVLLYTLPIDYRHVRLLANRIIGARSDELRAMRELDARDNANLRAYGLPEVR